MKVYLIGTKKFSIEEINNKKKLIRDIFGDLSIKNKPHKEFGSYFLGYSNIQAAKAAVELQSMPNEYFPLIEIEIDDKYKNQILEETEAFKIPVPPGTKVIRAFFEDPKFEVQFSELPENVRILYESYLQLGVSANQHHRELLSILKPSIPLSFPEEQLFQENSSPPRRKKQPSRKRQSRSESPSPERRSRSESSSPVQRSESPSSERRSRRESSPPVHRRVSPSPERERPNELSSQEQHVLNVRRVRADYKARWKRGFLALWLIFSFYSISKIAFIYTLPYIIQLAFVLASYKIFSVIGRSIGRRKDTFLQTAHAAYPLEKLQGLLKKSDEMTDLRRGVKSLSWWNYFGSFTYSISGSQAYRAGLRIAELHEQPKLEVIRKKNIL